MVKPLGRTVLTVVSREVGAMAVLGTAEQFQALSLELGMDATALWHQKNVQFGISESKYENNMSIFC
jgi:hypothetical protein